MTRRSNTTTGEPRTRTRRSSSNHAATQPPTGTAPRAVSPLDRRRYLDFRAGISVAELASRENARVDTIQRSIDKVISEHAQFSQEQAEVAARQLFLQTAPKVAEALTGALAATTTRTKTEMVLVRDRHTGTEEWVEREVEVEQPDHKTRLSAVDTWKSLPVAVTPHQPMVQVDARTQTINGAAVPSQHALPAGPLSSESIIRAIRAERGLAGADQPALTDGSAAAPAIDHDYELVAEMEEDGDLEDAAAVTVPAEIAD